MANLEITTSSQTVNNQILSSLIGPNGGIETMLTSTERRTLSSYNDGVGVGFTRVIQTDLPGIIWNLVSSDVTLDSSWIGLPYTVDPDGDVVVSMQLANFTGTVPDANVLGIANGTLRLGDGRTTNGQSVVSPPPTSLTLIVDAANAVTGFPATVIPASFKINQTTLRGLSIGSGVTAIGSSAFSGCTGLSGDLIIPDSVITIGTAAFQNCTGLSGRLILGKSVTTINQNSFSNCNFTGNLILPDSLTNFTSIATFQGCDQFTGDLVIPPNFTSFGSGKAFQNCLGFNGALYLPASLVSPTATTDFSGCTGFTRIYAACNASVITAGTFTPMIGVTTIYYKAGTTGWGATFEGKTTALWTSWPNPMP